MSRKLYSPEKIIGMLREVEISLAQGMTVDQVCRQLSIPEQTYYRWRKQYGGLKISQARRMKDIERENTRLKKAVDPIMARSLRPRLSADGWTEWG